MRTLYDLLGALPDDNAEGLRTAFRKAAKATHPDLNPDNPDAALRFRQLVRAYDILSDEEQRAAYDQLLAIATRPLPSKSKRVYEKLRIFASSTIAATIISGVLIASYAVMGNISPAPATAEDWVKTTAHVPADLIAAAMPDEPSDRRARMALAGLVVARSPSVPAVKTSGLWTASADPTLHLAKSDAEPREPGTFADRGDQGRVFTDFDLAIQRDPSLAAAYLDHAILFYRMRTFGRAFADMGPAKPFANSNQANTSQAKPLHAKPLHAKASHAKASQARTSQAKASQARPSALRQTAPAIHNAPVGREPMIAAISENR
jgi:curved DNA-binding protein CbpA